MDKYRDLKDIAKDIRGQLKKEFPQCKFSVNIDRFSMGESLLIALMNAPFAAFAKDVDVNGNPHDGDYAQLNQYQLRREPEEHICNGVYLTPEAWAAMKRADEIQRQYNWDNSDLQTDYFDVNFYFHPQIGKWNKPFEMKPGK
jgi:hypothetical protein